MFNGIKLKTFLSTPQEWHSFLIGFCEVLCPWPSRYFLTGAWRDEFMAEYHYYLAGRGVGLVALLFVLMGIVKFVLEVLL